MASDQILLRCLHAPFTTGERTKIQAMALKHEQELIQHAQSIHSAIYAVQDGTMRALELSICLLLLTLDSTHGSGCRTQYILAACWSFRNALGLQDYICMLSPCCCHQC